MAKPVISTKRLAIDKAQTQTVIAVGVASFVTVFCLIASKAVWSQNQYQTRVTKAKEVAHHQLQDNLKAFDTLVTSYKAFNATATNVIGGNSVGSGDRDGTNSKIILDALPPSYDFPALTSTIEKILKNNNLKISSIAGIDDQVNQQTNLTSASPSAVPMPFTFGVNSANYKAINGLLAALQSSIRPIQIDTISLSGSDNDLSMTVTAHTYYQPSKSVSITQKAIK